MHFFLQLCFLLHDCLAPDERVPIGVRFHFSAIDEVMLELYILLLGKKLKYTCEDGLQHVFHPLGTKAIQGTEVWALSTGNPHKHDVFPNRFGHLARGVDLLCVGVNDDFSEHLGVIAVTPPTWIGNVEDFVVQTIDRIVDDTNEVMRRNVVLQVHWQIKLVHGILYVHKETSPFVNGWWYFHFTKERFLFVYPE
ncbi:hypothetical protein D3C80_1220510 [compost metagenome]